MSTRRDAFLPARRQRGMTLIELIMFIIIVSVGLAGLLSALNVTVSHSADPLLRKQMLSIAEALMEEAEFQPFTYCDPSDTGWATATSATIGAGACTTTVQGLGVGGVGPNGETRINPTNPFNNRSEERRVGKECRSR